MAKASSASQHPDILAARRVFSIEIQGIKALDDWLGDAFIHAVDTLVNQSRTGRVIISGMGKSGHIARKIAATFSSTGTPAHFVHPGEASHGDLGMITANDVVILLSNSGETKELADIINYTKRFSIPLIGVVRRKTSTLVEAADVAMVLPEIEEACTVNAPTTSTTMMLALGDALAVALLERRGFNKDDFHVFHPGGKLGSSLLKLKDLMHIGDAMPLAPEDTPMHKAMLEMTSKRFGCVGITDKKGLLTGIITDGDLRRHLSNDLLKKEAREVMTANPIVRSAGTLATEALHIMEERSITTIFVIEEKKPIGIVHIHDILRSGVV